ncbi:MAG: hypothetical protein KAQ68_04225 [Clostridiales bacterium]|nr:hypothetical protein [Clostridiales bacterium]
MIKPHHKMISIIILLVITIFVGCTPKEVVPASTPTPEPTQAVQEVPYAETLELLFMPRGAVNTRVALSSKDIVVEFLEEKYNVKFNFIDTTSDPTKTYSEILSMHISYGVIPDYMNLDVLSTDQLSYEKLLQAGAVIDIGTYLDDKEDVYPKLTQYILNAKEINKYKTDDDELYCLPNLKGPDDLVYLVRGDWAEKAGININTVDTLDKFRLLMEAFVENDFDGLGTDGFSTGNQRYLDPIFAGFTGSYIFKDIDGQYVDWFLLDDMRNALTWLNEMYQTKAFDNDYLLHDGAVSQEKITSGKAGAIATDISNYPTLNAKLKETNPYGFLVPLPVSLTGNLGPCRTTGDTLSTAAMISVYFEEPNRILDMCEFLFTEQGMDIISYGIQGEHYVLDSNTKVPNYQVFDSEGWKYNKDGTTEGMQEYHEIRNIITQIEVVTLNDFPQSAIDWYYSLLKYSNIYTNPFADNGYTPTNKLSAFNAVKDTWIDNFISGKRALSDKYWDRFIKEYLEAGAQTQMDFYNNQ